MKITLQTKPLLAAMEEAHKSSSSKHHLPALSCVLIEDSGEGTYVSCDSLESRMRVWVDSPRSDVQFQLLAPYKQLQSALRGPEAVIEVLDGRLIVESGGRSVLGMLPLADFPPSWPPIPTSQLTDSSVFQALKIALGCCDSNSENIALECVKWDKANGQMVGCNKRTLVLSPCQLPLQESFLILGPLARLILQSFRDGESVEIGVENHILCLKNEKRTLWVKLLNGVYPDYTRIIPPVLEESVTLNREELLAAVKSLEGFSDECQKLSCCPRDGLWELSASHVEHESSITVKTSGATLEPFLASVGQFVKLLQSWPHDEVRVNDGTAALRVSPVGQDGPVGVIVKLRPNA